MEITPPLANSTTAQHEALAKMSHDMRTPLHVIDGLSSILASSQTLTPAEKGMAEMLKTNAAQLAALIENMTAFAHNILSEKNKAETETPGHCK
jgi:signal transduction histidine kinase